MVERQGAVMFKGKALTLVGDAIERGQTAPQFNGVATDMSEQTLAGYAGKVVVICSVPSLDTPVCDTEIRRFNQEAGRLGEDVVVLVVSMDLPFAQTRWCGAAGVENVVTLSDYKDRAFGSAYGLYVKELGLLARAVLVIDKEGVVQYVEVVAEMTDEPDYDAALKAARAAI